MPFEIQSLSVLAYANGFTLWHYRTDNDTRSQMLSTGYFNPAAHLVRRGDMVLARSSDAFSILHVTAHSGSTVNVAALV
ncbi:hypothetical protein [Elioraea tepidiphila]|jgi:hypothetical protein|uniref:hypothetical protein n=1 Tax=Elioraea tepidiphila TaxID=457934 RepID=UPI0003697F51|nr:hypothetical protein [Elioraea tepidiphila]